MGVVSIGLSERLSVVAFTDDGAIKELSGFPQSYSTPGCFLESGQTDTNCKQTCPAVRHESPTCCIVLAAFVATRGLSPYSDRRTKYERGNDEVARHPKIHLFPPQVL